MHLVFLTHPFFITSQSMPRFSNMLTNGMLQRGHTVEVWAPTPQFYNLPVPSSLKKWMGYIDQYIIFPNKILKKIQSTPDNTLFVFTDHALGPWVPLIKQYPHVIHCHDFLAQHSAMGEIPENKTSKSGQKYQAYIRSGYQQGKNFISVSHQTRDDLHRFLGYTPLISEVVYNGMNRNLLTQSPDAARTKLSTQTGINLSQGYLLHVGGNQWYKNRAGVINIYSTWRKMNAGNLPLLMIGLAPTLLLQQVKDDSPYAADIHFLSGLTDEHVQSAYAGASLFLYPSLAEGFGWPIAEAMAAGCIVVTTGEAPMTEVGGNAAFYIPRKPYNEAERDGWATQCAQTVEQLLSLNLEKRRMVIQKGLDNVTRFNTENSLDCIEAIYASILKTEDK